MQDFDPQLLKSLYKPASSSHKGENGKVMVIGGSKLFHAAFLWPLTVASRIVDMVFYSSTEENNELVQKAKEEFRNGIIVPRGKIDDYIAEAEAVLIGSGMPREEGLEEGDDDTGKLTEELLKRNPDKKWVIDGGSLQTIDPEILLNLKTMPILTPHAREFEILESRIIPTRGLTSSKGRNYESREKIEDRVSSFAKKYKCVVLYKGEFDIVSSPTETVRITGGNAGMTKGGTGDVLAGLVVGLFAKNDAFLTACTASYINKKAGESLEEKMGIYFNSSDLASEIPLTMEELLG